MAKLEIRSIPFKKIVALTLVGCLVGLEIETVSYTVQNPAAALIHVVEKAPAKTALYLNDKIITLKHAPIMADGILTVPAAEILQHMGIQTKVLDSGKTVIGYRNNVFLKFQNNSITGSRNGKSVHLGASPYMNAGVMYVPLDFITRSYHYDATEGPHSLHLKSPDGNGRFTLLDNVYYKTANIPSLDVNFSIPDYWEKKDKAGTRYGYKNDYETVTLDISRYHTQTTDLSAIIEAFITSRIGPQSNMTVQTVDKIRISELEAADISAVRTLGVKNDITEDYLIRQGNTVFNLHFRIQGKNHAGDTKVIFKNIARSFKVNSLSVDYAQEYYLEYDNFHRYDFKLSSDLYSSLLVDSVLQVKGSVDPGLPYNKLVAIVTKDHGFSYFTLPVKKGKFTGNIYTPFGLGKHNITLVLVPQNLARSSYTQLASDPKSKILELSIINTSTRDITYLIPSAKVSADDPEIINLANLKTYKNINRLDKARSLFEWLLNNVRMESRSRQRNAVDVFRDSRGSEEELNFLYTALLRAIGTPSRVVRGDIHGRTTYWTEVQFNGTWVVSDLPRALQMPHSADDSAALAHFSLDLRKYYETRENIKRLDH